MNEIDKAKEIRAYLLANIQLNRLRLENQIRTAMNDDNLPKTLAEKMAEESVNNGGAAFRLREGYPDIERFAIEELNGPHIAEWVAQLKYGLDFSNEAEWDMRRRGFGWEEYQLAGAGLDPDPNDDRWCAAWTPPDPLHAKKGKRRDTKAKKQPRKKVKLGRRDSRRK